MPKLWSTGHPCVRSLPPVGNKENGVSGETKWEKGDSQNKEAGMSLVVHWLRLHASSAGGLGSILGQGTRSHMLQLRPSAGRRKKKSHH